MKSGSIHKNLKSHDERKETQDHTDARTPSSWPEKKVQLEGRCQRQAAVYKQSKQ